MEILMMLLLAAWPQSPASGETVPAPIAPGVEPELEQWRVGWWQQPLPTAAAQAGRPEPGWRRTNRGWEHVDAWPRVDRTGRKSPPLHPLQLALLQLISLAAVFLIAHRER